MTRKRILAAALAAMLAVPFSLTGIGSVVQAENGNHERYYYDQLGADAKGIYEAMYAMYENGIFKTGTQEYDLVANGHLTSDQLAAYGGKQDEVLKLFGAARDAFYADYPDIFYVDFSNLSINVTETTVSHSSVSDSSVSENDSDTVVYSAYLGTGRTDTYFVQGFNDQAQVESAVGEHDRKIDMIVQGARNQSQSVREQVIYVNNAIIENTVYKLEMDCSPGNSGHVRTSYGALVKGESLCEGYARAVKTVLDGLGIRNVLVQGSYRAPDGSDNLHMWNYLQIDGKWYGLDATANDGMKGSTDREKYLLAEKAVMEQNHVPDGVMSAAGFCFSYPQLAGGEAPDEGSGDDGSADDGEYKTIFEEGGFLVQYRDGTVAEGDIGIFKVSYKGMGYQEAVDREGIYILSRFYQFMPGSGTYKAGDWGYSDPKPFAIPQLEDALLLSNANSRYIEFAITKKEPAGPLYGEGLSTEELNKNWTFQGTESDFLISTGKLDNPKGTFVPSPFARNLTPSNTGFLSMDKKHHITAVFNEKLKVIDGQSAGYELTVKDGWSAEENSKIENFTWDGDRTVEFDLTPSRMLADNYATYVIQVTGLQGAESLKAPDSFSYDVKKRIAICTYRPQGIYLTLGAKPILLEQRDLSYDDWKTEDGKKLTDVVDRVKLVATKPVLESEQPAKQADQMMEEIKNQLEPGSTITKSATYDIRLTHCNHNVIQTGNSVRFFIGFPEGFSPEQGSTYKAYHFRKDGNGGLVAEEISCVVTDVGLMVTCNAFSPFAIVEVQDPTGASSVTQKLLVMNSDGGEVEIENNQGDKICKLTGKKDARTISIRAKDGYSINKIYLSDKGERRITNNKSMKLTLKYEDLAGCNNILDVTFVEEKQEPDETKPNQPQPEKPKPNQPQPNNPKPEAAPAGTNAGEAQQNSGTSQSGSSGTSGNSGSGQAGNSGNSAGSGSASTGSKQAAFGADKSTAAQTPQEQAKVQKQQPASTSTTAVSSASSLSGKENESDADGSAELASSGQGTAMPEKTLAAEEREEESTAPLTGNDDVLKSGDADIAGRKSGISGLLWTILISVAGAGIIVGAIAGYVRMKRKWSE